MPREFDWERSRDAAEEAMGRVDNGADPDFKLEAYTVVHYLALTVHEFTTDRVWWELQRRGATDPREPRALGPIMRRAQTLEWIADTGRMHLTMQVSAHRRPKRVWRSVLIGAVHAA